MFFLPFVLPRIFRPSLLMVFDITNVELGSYYTIYGIVAMVSYFFGGPLADRYSARYLMSIALWLTALGGLAMSFLPANDGMKILYAFWGFTSILMFWAALIRATREWGGVYSQGRAFGLLEGGRGLTAALFGTLALVVFADYSAESANQVIVPAERVRAFRNVILYTSISTMLAGVFVWLFVPDNKEYRPNDRIQLKHITSLLKMPSLWLLALIIICAYVGYKITDTFSLYANEVLGFDELKSAAFGTGALWMRALVAFLAAIIADKVKTSRIISFSFILSIAGGGLAAMGILENSIALVIINLAMLMVGIYSIKALYFALIQEARIPIFYTGTAVGLISIIGFTPDIFMSPWMGYLLDNSPGAEGHRHVFAVLALFAIVGLVASLRFIYLSNKKNDVPERLYTKGA